MSDCDRPEQVWLPALSVEECAELAAGRVPDWLRESARACVEFALETGPVDYAGLAQQRQRTTKKQGRTQSRFPEIPA